MTATGREEEIYLGNYQNECTSWLKSEDQVVNIDIVQNDFEDFVEFLNNEFKCRLLTTVLFGNEKHKENEKTQEIKVEVSNREEDSKPNHIEKEGLTDFQTSPKPKPAKKTRKDTRKTRPDRETRKICDLCGKSYKEVYKLKLHIKEVHEGSREYACTQCDFTARRGYELKNHMYYKHGQGIKTTLYCEFCGYSNVNKSALEEHRERMHLKNEYKCEREGCGYIAKSKRMDRDHRAFHKAQDEGVVLQCSTCGKGFPTNKLLKSHQRSHARAEAAVEKKCELCDYKTNKPKMFERHMYFRHTRENAKEKERYKGWDWEIMREKWRNGKGNKEKNIECPHCNYKTNTSSNYHRHIRTIHPDEEQTNNEYCEQTLNTNVT